ncbi:uncharacterized protein LOC106090594 [Stomoxys calcitrans]|uniref:Uncharacterized protein n=1 Tax=Stomoxys calcitrans TaxID=35570 RepID=A0A1I8NPM5_STOCA|nr:uncharacterized protein LOC106090594 [Stomoxys calcitrans]
MQGITLAKIFNILGLLLALVVIMAHSSPLPVPVAPNYETVMLDDNVPAESFKYQTFQNFYNAELPGNPMAELQMVESRNAAKIRAPQPLNAAERQARLHDEYFDVVREKRNQKSLTKGSTKPNRHGQEWEEFDYDAYVN